MDFLNQPIPSQVEWVIAVVGAAASILAIPASSDWIWRKHIKEKWEERSSYSAKKALDKLRKNIEYAIIIQDSNTTLYAFYSRVNALRISRMIYISLFYSFLIFTVCTLLAGGILNNENTLDFNGQVSIAFIMIGLFSSILLIFLFVILVLNIRKYKKLERNITDLYLDPKKTIERMVLLMRKLRMSEEIIQEEIENLPKFMKYHDIEVVFVSHDADDV